MQSNTSWNWLCSIFIHSTDMIFLETSELFLTFIRRQVSSSGAGLLLRRLPNVCRLHRPSILCLSLLQKSLTSRSALWASYDCFCPTPSCCSPETHQMKSQQTSKTQYIFRSIFSTELLSSQSCQPVSVTSNSQTEREALSSTIIKLLKPTDNTSSSASIALSTSPCIQPLFTVQPVSVSVFQRCPAVRKDWDPIPSSVLSWILLHHWLCPVLPKVKCECVCVLPPQPLCVEVCPRVRCSVLFYFCFTCFPLVVSHVTVFCTSTAALMTSSSTSTANITLPLKSSPLCQSNHQNHFTSVL